MHSQIFIGHQISTCISFNIDRFSWIASFLHLSRYKCHSHDHLSIFINMCTQTTLLHQPLKKLITYKIIEATSNNNYSQLENENNRKQKMRMGNIFTSTVCYIGYIFKPIYSFIMLYTTRASQQQRGICIFNVPVTIVICTMH